MKFTFYLLALLISQQALCQNPTLTSSNASICAGASIDLNSLISTNGTIVYWAEQPQAIAVSAGSHHSIALLSNEVIHAWGTNNYGEGTDRGFTAPPIGISAANNYNISLLNNSTLRGWGSRTYTRFFPPTAVMADAGADHDLTLLSTGVIVGWGDDTYGQVTIPTFAATPTAVSAGGYHSLALLNNGDVAAWGNNNFGQATNKTFAAAAIAISAGFSHNLALLSNGTVTGWGSNDHGEITIPGFDATPIAISAGNEFSLALLANGTVVGWGNNGLLQTNIPTFASTPVAISAGDGFGLALLADGSVKGWGTNAHYQSSGYDPLQISNGMVTPTQQTTYYVIVRNASGGKTTGMVTVVVKPTTSSVDIAITTGAQSICVGTSVTFTATPTNGGTSPSYQWKKGNTNVGTNSATYTDAALADNDIITCQMTSNAECQVIPTTTSAAIVMSVNALTPTVPLVTIAITSGSQNICTGTSVTFTATPTNGGAAPGYQWKKNGINVGTNATTYTSTVLANNDVITCVMTSTAPCSLPPTATSSPVTITVFYPSVSIAITTGSQSITLGTSVTFTATPAQAGSSPTYQWQRNGENIVGATGATYTSTTLANNNFISCVMTTTSACAFPVSISSAGILITVTSTGPTLATTNTIICRGDSVNLSSLITTNGSSISWSEKPQAINMAANTFHSLAVLSNGTVTGWGGTPETIIPPVFAAKPIAVGAAEECSFALLENGAVVGWGYNRYGQMTIPAFAATPKTLVVGYQHNSALLNNGTVVGWGRNNSGQNTIPAFAAIPLAISESFGHSLALLTNSAVVGWGDNTYGQATAPTFASTPIAISAGAAHSLALLANGSVVGWGNNFYGQITIPAFAAPVKTIFAGNSFSAAILSTGAVVAWGDNSNGQTNVPALAAPAIAIAAGEFHSLALLNNGSVVGWGGNTAGQANGYTPLPLSSSIVAPTSTKTYYIVVRDSFGVTRSDSVTVMINPLSASVAIAITSGSDIICPGTSVSFKATAANAGTTPVYQWKKNNNVVGTNSDTYTDANLANSDSISCVVTPDNTATCINMASSPVITITVNPVLTPSVSIAITSGSQSINTGTSVTFTATPVNAGTTPTYQWKKGGTDISGETGAVYTTTTLANNDVISCVMTSNYPCVTSNSASSAGITITVSNLPSLSVSNTTICPGNSVDLNSLITTNGSITTWTDPVTSISAGSYFNLVLSGSGTVSGWGYNHLGQRTIPTFSAHPIAIATGTAQSIALLTNGTVVCWGDNSYGQSTNPTFGASATAISAGELHNIALLSNGTVVGWGNNEYGQTTIPSFAATPVKISAGSFYNLALLSNGSVVGWGQYSSGQTTIPTFSASPVAIAAGSAHGLALLSNGTVVGWGSNNLGQTTIPSFSAPPVAISAKRNHSLALLSDGTVVGWGDNSYGQTTIPAFDATPIAVAAGATHSLALLSNGTVVGWGSNIVGENASYNPSPLVNTTVSPTSTSSYYVQVENSTGGKNGASVTVTVNPFTLPTGTNTITQNVSTNALIAPACKYYARITDATGFTEVTLKQWNENNPPYTFVSRHYEITPATNAATANANVVLYFSQSDFDVFNANAANTLKLPANAGDVAGIANIRIVKYPGVSSPNNGLPESYSSVPVQFAPSSSVYNTTTGFWEINFLVTGFSGFFVKTGNAVLPVSLISFKGKATNAGNELTWTTAAENNFSHYEIERKTDAGNFEKIGVVNGSNQGTYSFVDALASINQGYASTFYYRLTMVDLDGVKKQSEVVVIKRQTDNFSIYKIYPSPVTDYLRVDYNLEKAGVTVFSVYDFTGKLIYNNKIQGLKGDNSKTMDVRKWAAGTYYLKMKNGAQLITEKFVKL